MTSSGNKVYTGGCHCGFVRYSIQGDLHEPNVNKCNCSICLKLNLMAYTVDPSSNFTLEKPTNKNDPGFGIYNHGAKRFNFYFCKTCSVSCYYEGSYESPTDGKKVSVLQVNIVTLDPDQDVDLRKARVKYWDGKTDNWMAGLNDEPWPGGIV